MINTPLAAPGKICKIMRTVRDTPGRICLEAYPARGVLIMISTPLAGYASRHILPGVSLTVRMILHILPGAARGVLIMISTLLASDRTPVRSVAGSDFIYTKNSAPRRPRFDFIYKLSLIHI